MRKILEKINMSLNKKSESSDSSFFNPLSPTDDADGCNIYFESLDWALKNKKRIKNIAISGPYGSGKSSVIQTYIKRREDYNKNIISRLWNKIFPEDRFFNISLATFKDTRSTVSKDFNDIQYNESISNSIDENPQSLDNVELQRLIELSIIQQLFFHEKDSQIPDSRFKKIKRQKKFKLLSYSFGLILFITSFLYLLYPKLLRRISSINFDDFKSDYIPITASILFFAGLFFLIYKLSRSLISISIRKLNIHYAEIEIDKSISKSILNNHLDEIIYFFEATKYNVIIIEDLDRFEQTEVFTKLREINLLINNSKKVGRDIVFIYAIKDDMFKDKDRTKFFDFIIPIMPVINFSNSKSKLIKIAYKNGYSIDDKLLDNLSIFIDDMRLLYNITNEFYIYSKKIENSLDMNKLLAIIIYKNIYPNDFTKLNENDGDLYKTIKKKADYIESVKHKLDDEIVLLRKHIVLIEKERINDIYELRIIYIAKVIEKIAGNFIAFKVNDDRVNISDFAKDEYFSNIKNDLIEYYGYNHSYRNIKESSIKLDFSEIEEEVNADITYIEREELINDQTVINKLKKQIELKFDQKNIIQKSKLKDILSNRLIKIDSDSSRKNDLINLLLREGYIDENYLNYITVFHEGALTKSDYQFLINTRIDKLNEFDFKLNKTNELLKLINTHDFEKQSILNFDLVDTILNSNNYPNEKELLFKQLSSESDIVTMFINQFLDRTQYVELFIFELCKYWQNIWIYVDTNYTPERTQEYFNQIIRHAYIDNITAIFRDNTKSINQFSEFLNIKADEEKLKEIIKNLKIKFISIEINSPLNLLDFVFENKHYAINIEMIRKYISFKKEFKVEPFETKNYSYILSTKNQSLIDYIESNIHEYIESVYLKLKNNVNEEITSFSKLLNNNEIDIEQKNLIILHSKIIIEDIRIINKLDVIYLLLDNLMVAPTWENILEVFRKSEGQINKELNAFLNQYEIALKLSEMKMKTVKDEDGDLLYIDLCKAIIYNQNINLESFSLLVSSIPWWYEEFESDKLSQDRVTVLIEKKLVSPTISSFVFLSENYKGSNVLLLEKNIAEFKDKIKEISIDSDDLVLILKSKVIDLKSKFEFIDRLEDAEVMSEHDSIRIIIRYLVDSKAYDVRDSLKLLLLNSEDLEAIDRIKLFNNNLELLDLDELDGFIISLGGNYEKISNKNRQANIKDTLIHRLFLKNLEKLEYISSFSEDNKGLRVYHKRT